MSANNVGKTVTKVAILVSLYDCGSGGWGVDKYTIVCQSHFFKSAPSGEAGIDYSISQGRSNGKAKY